MITEVCDPLGDQRRRRRERARAILGEGRFEVLGAAQAIADSGEVAGTAAAQADPCEGAFHVG